MLQRRFQTLGATPSAMVGLRLEHDAVPTKAKSQEAQLPNPATRWPVEVVSPQGWIVRLQNGSDVQMLPELLQALPC